MSMIMFEDPDHCPKCKSKNIILGQKVYKKDDWGEDTDIVISSMWLCNECGNVIGRKIFECENDIAFDSV